MADDPADVRRRPEHLARLDAIKVRHRPLERDHVAAIVAHHALGLPGRAGGVEDVERVGGGDGNARHLAALRQFRLHRGAHVDVAALHQIGGKLLALEDEAAVGLVGRLVDGAADERHVGDGAVGLDAARRRDDRLRRGVVDAGGKLVRGEPAEDDGMDRADARARQHRHHRFRDHRHVDDDPVALGNALVDQHAGQRIHPVERLGVGIGERLAGDGAVIDDRRLAGPVALHVPVEAIVAGVALGPFEPAAIGALVGIEDLVPRLRPVDLGSGLGPEALRVFLPGPIDLVITARHGVFLPHRRRIPCGRLCRKASDESKPWRFRLWTGSKGANCRRVRQADGTRPVPFVSPRSAPSSVITRRSPGDPLPFPRSPQPVMDCPDFAGQ